MNHRCRGGRFFVLAWLLCAAASPPLDQSSTRDAAVLERGWNLVTIGGRCAVSPLVDIPAVTDAFDDVKAIWASQRISPDEVIWEEVQRSSWMASLETGRAAEYWLFSETRQAVLASCDFLVTPTLADGTRWNAKEQIYLTKTGSVAGAGDRGASLSSSGAAGPDGFVSLSPMDTEAGDGRVAPNPPHGLEAVLDGHNAKFQWVAPERLTDGTPIPPGVPIGYRVYRDGLPVYEGQNTGFEDVLPGEGAHRYYVTASLFGHHGTRRESGRSDDIDMSGSVPLPSRAHDAFEVPLVAAKAADAALPQLAFAEWGGDLVAHLAFVVRDRVGGVGDEVRYARSTTGGRDGSWSEPLSVVTTAGAQILDLGISSHGSSVVVAWIEKTSASGDGVLSQVFLLESDDGGATWPAVPRVVRSNDRWKRGLDLAHDVLGELHAVWGEAGKVYYVKNFAGDPSNVFDRQRRKLSDELIKYKVRYEEGPSGCRCPDCWCEESYVLGGDGEGAYVHWVEEHTMLEPSLHVDAQGIHIIARRSVMWEGVPVVNPAWEAMLASSPVYSTQVTYGEKETRPVVGWRKTWKHAREPGDDAKARALGVAFQYLYDGTRHEEDYIMLAQRPLVEGAWSDLEVLAGSDQDPSSGAEVVHGRGGWDQGVWVDGAFQAWRISTVDALAGDESVDRPAHPHVARGPGGTLYAVYEQGPSADPNVPRVQALMLSHSEDGGQHWSAGRVVGQGYMPKLTSTSSTVAVLSYVPYSEEAGPQDPPGGLIQLLRTRDGNDFRQEMVNRIWNPTNGEQEIAVAGVIHGRTHGKEADVLWGVPELVSHGDLIAAVWLGAPKSALGRQEIMVSRAALLEPDEVESRVVVLATEPLVSGKVSAFRVQVENQYHVAVPESLGAVRFVEGDGLATPGQGPSGADHLDGGSFANQEGSSLGGSAGGSFGPEAALAGAHVLGGSTATLWRAFDGVGDPVSLSVQSAQHQGVGLRATAVLSGAVDGNYARAVSLRDGRYHAGRGAQREFLADEGNEDTAQLAEYERVWVYTQGIALAQAARRGEKNAEALARWLCERAVRDQADPGVILGWHFSHNTAGDNWKDFRLVTGASAWAVHGLGIYVSTGGTEASFARECYQASLRGLLQSQTESGLFTAGYTASELLGAGSGAEYYGILDKLGYDDETPRVRATNVVTEHNVDALQVLNHALHHHEVLGVSEDELSRSKEALKRAIFTDLWDVDQKRVITGGVFDRAGTFVPSRFSAVDNCSWLSLSVDYASLSEEEVGKIGTCLQYTIDAFVKELPFDEDPQDRRYLGTHYFPADFRDPYIDLSLAEQAKQPKSYHLEATSGVILGLWRFAEETEHPQGVGFRRVANELWAEMQRFVRDHDFPYSSQRIHNLSTQLQSSTAAIWFIDVYDHQRSVDADWDRPLKSYARLPTASTAGPWKVSFEDGKGAERVPERVITAKMVRDHFFASIQALDQAALEQDSHIADQGIWNPRDLEIFDYRSNFHNQGQYDPAHFDVDLDLPEAWSIMPDAGDFVVAVIDSGGWRTDPNVNYWTNPHEIPDDRIDNDQNGYVDDTWGWDFFDEDNDPTRTNPHGVRVARWLAEVPRAGSVGVAPGAQVLALRISNDGSELYYPVPFNTLERWFPTPVTRMLDAMDYAIGLKLQHLQGQGGADIRVMNVSWGTDLPLWGKLGPLGWIESFSIQEAFQAAVARAEDAGIVVVAAAANERDATMFPAELYAPNLLGVVSTGPDDELLSFSDRGRNLEIAAPLYYYEYYSYRTEDDRPQEGYLVGNSFASPMVAGAALLAWRVAPGALPKQIRQALMYGVDRRPSLEGAVVSGGRLNVFRTLQHLRLAQFRDLPGGGQTSAIEDKIEQAGAEVHYHLHLPEGLPLRVWVEPLWLDAGTVPTLWPSLEVVLPTGKRHTVSAEALGEPVAFGPVPTMHHYGDDHHRFIITGLSKTTGPFRLRVTLGGAEEEASRTREARTLEDHALQASAWLSLARFDDAKSAVAEILADFGVADFMDPALASLDPEREWPETTMVLEDTALGLYGILRHVSRSPKGADLEPLLSQVGRRLPEVATRALADVADSKTTTSSLVYVYFALDLALTILQEEFSSMADLAPDVLPSLIQGTASSIETLARLKEAVTDRLTHDLWDEGVGRPFATFSASEATGEATQGDMVLYGLFSLHRGETARAFDIITSLEKGRAPNLGDTMGDGVQRFAESEEAWILLLRAAGPLDPRLEELALARLLALPPTSDGTHSASRVVAHRPGGIFGIRVGPSAWTRDLDDRNPPIGVGVHFHVLSEMLLPLFRDGLYALLASGFEPHVFDHWVERLEQIRFAWHEADEERWPYQWVEAYESRNREVTLNETLWDLAHLCDLPMVDRATDHRRLVHFLGVSCEVLSEAFSHRLEERLEGSPRSDYGLLRSQDGGETLRFSQLVRALHDPLPRTLELHQGPPGLTFGTLEGHTADFDDHLFPTTWGHFHSICFDGWLNPAPDRPQYCEPPSDDADAAEVQTFLRTLRSRVLEQALSEGEKKGHPVAFQLWGIDGLEAMNPGSPAYWAPTSVELRAVLDRNLDTHWWFLDIPVASFEGLDPAQTSNGLWLRRLINQEADGDLLRVASALGNGPGTIHHWLKSGVVTEGAFFALADGLALQNQTSEWRARFWLSPDDSTEEGRGLPASGPLWAGEGGVLPNTRAEALAWLQGGGAVLGALAVASPGDVGRFEESLAPGVPVGPDFDFEATRPPSAGELAEALGAMVRGLSDGAFADAPPGVAAEWGARLLLAPGRLAARFGAPASRWLDEVARLPKEWILAAGIGLDAAAYLSSAQVDVGLETILVSGTAPTSPLWERVGVVSPEDVVVQPAGTHFKNEEALRAVALIHAEGPVLENPLSNPGEPFEEHGVYLIQIDWLGFEAPFGHFGLLTPSTESLWPVYKLKTSRPRSALLEDFVRHHVFWKYIAPFADTLPPQERIAFLYVVELMIRGEFDRLGAERFVVAGGKGPHGPNGTPPSGVSSGSQSGDEGSLPSGDASAGGASGSNTFVSYIPSRPFIPMSSLREREALFTLKTIDRDFDVNPDKESKALRAWLKKVGFKKNGLGTFVPVARATEGVWAEVFLSGETGGFSRRVVPVSEFSNLPKKALGPSGTIDAAWFSKNMLPKLSKKGSTIPLAQNAVSQTTWYFGTRYQGVPSGYFVGEYIGDGQMQIAHYSVQSLPQWGEAGPASEVVEVDYEQMIRIIGRYFYYDRLRALDPLGFVSASDAPWAPPPTEADFGAILDTIWAGVTTGAIDAFGEPKEGGRNWFNRTFGWSVTTSLDSYRQGYELVWREDDSIPEIVPVGLGRLEVFHDGRQPRLRLHYYDAQPFPFAFLMDHRPWSISGEAWPDIHALPRWVGNRSKTWVHNRALQAWSELELGSEWEISMIPRRGQFGGYQLLTARRSKHDKRWVRRVVDASSIPGLPPAAFRGKKAVDLGWLVDNYGGIGATHGGWEGFSTFIKAQLHDESTDVFVPELATFDFRDPDDEEERVGSVYIVWYEDQSYRGPRSAPPKVMPVDWTGDPSDVIEKERPTETQVIEELRRDPESLELLRGLFGDDDPSD